MNVDKATIAVTGVGMVSALALDVVTSCAAAPDCLTKLYLNSRHAI